MNNEWKVKIFKDGPDMYDSLFIYRDGPDGKIEIITKFDSAGGIASTFCERNGTVLPAMRMDTRDLRQIVAAFVKYSQEQGFKSSDESFAQGKLTATEKHLEDMRTLVFKKK